MDCGSDDDDSGAAADADDSSSESGPSLQPTADQAEELIKQLEERLNEPEILASGVDVSMVRALLKDARENQMHKRYVVGVVGDSGVGKVRQYCNTLGNVMRRK